ncbi:MAG: acetate--CoA ligase family protein [Microthrixaceae bacterium]
MPHTLSEVESRNALAAEPSIALVDAVLASDPDGAVAAAAGLGYPVVAKLCGDAIAHKSERGLVRLGIGDDDELRVAVGELLAAGRPEDGVSGVLIAPAVAGRRELIAGLATDPAFGHTVLLGVGGVLAEAIADVAVRVVPITEVDAAEMIEQLDAQALLGAFRGEPAVDRESLVATLVGLSRFAEAHPEVVSVDLNPLIVVDGRPIAVDALVEIDDRDPGRSADASVAPPGPRHDAAAFRALFDPAGVVVAGASTHPGKFGFVSLHNLIASGYRGRISATNREGARVLGIDTVPSVAELEPGSADLVFVCTPKAAVPGVLRDAAAIGVRAAFLASAGYGESGEDGRAEQAALVELCDELDLLLIGPNGQGVVSTPSSLCAQIVAPYPPAGHVSVVSQSGNLVSSFLNWSCSTGVGVARAVSAGNAAATDVVDVLEFLAVDPATRVSLAYIEGLTDGRHVARGLRSAAAAKPLVVLKGGATEGGARAAASHTGSLATDDATFDGLCRQVGITRASGAEDAFDAAATFATQPLPRGPRVAIVTTVGGWGVLAADAVTRHPDLELAGLPEDLRSSLDELLPPRWSRNNPIDLAGGETRDTVPAVLELVAAHDDVDAVIFLGLGIQSNQARLLREGGFYPDHGTERIVAYHERQDARFAEAAAAISVSTGKPLLTATELAVAFPDNAGPAAVRASGRLCYPSAERAVAALGHLARRQRFLQRRGLDT